MSVPPRLFSQFMLTDVWFQWVYSLFFMLLDHSSLGWLEKYRIHEPEAIKRRNKATVPQVIKAVAMQQLIQTLLGWWWLDPTHIDEVDHIRTMLGLYRSVSFLLQCFLDADYYQTFMISNGPRILSAVYWWILPTAQFAVALWAVFNYNNPQYPWLKNCQRLVMDTWQYFLHRLFHANQFLYRNFHSVHHRLYVPYAFGALYNHWFEGLLLDTLGACIAHALPRMTVRQGILLFTFSTLKTVDDHCGYSFPFDPFQFFFPNNSTYHDVHHRVRVLHSLRCRPCMMLTYDIGLGDKV